MEGNRWPVTLWLHIFKDMWRLIALTAGVLVTVIAFAAAVKPLADGQLSPVQCVKFMGMAMLPMLQYALPFAACFGATLAYYRLASDNEVTAASAGGISYRTLLIPPAITGVVLAVLIWWLANSTIPRFLKGMAEMVSQNATQFIESSVLQGQALRTEIGGRPAYVYADHVRRYPITDPKIPYDRLWLKGILLVTLDEREQVATQGTAREAIVWLRSGGEDQDHTGNAESSTEVVLQPAEFVGVQESGKVEGGAAVQTFRVPNKFKDDPKFMTAWELFALSANPEKLPQVDKRRSALARLIAQSVLVQQIRTELRSAGQTQFVGPDKASFSLHARDLRPSKNPGWWRILPRKGENAVAVVRTEPGGATREHGANYAEMRVTRTRDPITEEEYVSVQLRLNDISAAVPEEVDLPEGAAAAGGAIKELKLSDLVPLNPQVQSVLAQSSSELVAAADQRISNDKAADPELIGTRHDLLRRTADLLREVLSKHHERLAMSFACLVMVLTGSVMAMRLRESLPLTIYLWAFFPALGAVLTISTGQQLTHQHGWIALPVLWGGVIGLGLYTLREYNRLARN